MPANAILDPLIMDIEQPSATPPMKEYVWLRDPATGDEVAFPASMENSIAILLSVGYRVFVPSDR